MGRAVILDEIIEATRSRVAESKKKVPLSDLKDHLGEAKAVRDFRGALGGEGMHLIAEVKRASPSKGLLRADLDVEDLVQVYFRSGAAAISVLTEPSFFKGGFADLAMAREAVDLPLLCKDFIIEPYQIYEARCYGADCVLLIVTALSLAELDHLMDLAHQLGMAALVEVHNEQEMETALFAEGNLIGINNRNLADFNVDLGTTSRLARIAPPEVTLVSESGIKSRSDVLALQKAGAKAVLVGEMLVTSADPGAEIRALMGN